MNKLISLQILRALAATIVVILHVLQRLEIRPIGDFFISGQYSVDIFFMLSGFLIYITTSKSTNVKKYISKRILRIYPMYIFTLILFIIYGVFFEKINYGIKTIIQNILMLPWDSKWFYGNLIVGVAWSTMFELYFYSLFLVILFLKLNKKYIFFIIPFLYVIGKLLLKLIGSDTPFLSLFASISGTYFVFLFFIGCILGEFWQNKYLFRPKRTVFNIILIFSIILFISIHCVKYNILFSIPISTLLFYCALKLDDYYKIDYNNYLMRLLNYLGDISFSIYLIHVLIIDIIIFQIGITNLFLTLTLTILLTYIISSFTYKYIEKIFIEIGNKIKTN